MVSFYIKLLNCNCLSHHRCNSYTAAAMTVMNLLIAVLLGLVQRLFKKISTLNCC